MKKKQRITLGISVLILLVLGFWVHSRWHVWFGNPEEPAYLPLNAPGRVLLTFGGMYGLEIRKNRLIFHSALPEEYC